MIVSRYWRYFAVAGIIVAILGAVYVKGHHDADISAEKAVVRETNRRIEGVGKEREATQRIRGSIRSSRQRTPQDDARDSCLLSSDIFTTNCLKK